MTSEVIRSVGVGPMVRLLRFRGKLTGLRGRSAYTAEATCMASGAPAISIRSRNSWAADSIRLDALAAQALDDEIRAVPGLRETRPCALASIPSAARPAKLVCPDQPA